MATTNIYIDRTTTWNAIGKSVEECTNMEQVLRASGLTPDHRQTEVF